MKTFIEFINEDTTEKPLFACIQIPYSDKYHEIMSEDQINTNCLAILNSYNIHRSIGYQCYVEIYFSYKKYLDKQHSTIHLSKTEFDKCFKQLTPQQVAALKYNI